MTKYVLKIETSGNKGTINVPFHEREAAEESERELRDYMAKGGGIYGLPGITTLFTNEVTNITVVPYEDEDE